MIGCPRATTFKVEDCVLGRSHVAAVVHVPTQQRCTHLSNYLHSSARTLVTATQQRTTLVTTTQQRTRTRTRTRERATKVECIASITGWASSAKHQLYDGPHTGLAWARGGADAVPDTDAGAMVHVSAMALCRT